MALIAEYEKERAIARQKELERLRILQEEKEALERIRALERAFVKSDLEYEKEKEKLAEEEKKLAILETQEEILE